MNNANIKDYAQQNTGFIPEDIRDTDLVFGQNERVDHYINIGSGNWLNYYSRGELQHGTYYDTAGCVSFSALNILEAWINYLIRNKKMSIENLLWLNEKGYIDENNEFDCSDRFTVAMSGTTSRGNTASKVWNSIRNHGVVPEAMCPWDRGRNAPYDERFAEWYRNQANITEEAKALGLEFKARFDVLYERVRMNTDEPKQALKHSPIHVFLSTSCPYDDNRVQQPCDGSIGHAVSQIDDDDLRGYIPLFDHYLKNPQEKGQEQFIRRVASNFKFYYWGFVITVVEKNVIHNDNNMLKLIKGTERAEVYALGKNGKRYHIYNEAVFNKGKEAGLWGDWDTIEIRPQADVELIPQDNTIAFLLG